jgi:hypothetical protein
VATRSLRAIGWAIPLAAACIAAALSAQPAGAVHRWTSPASLGHGVLPEEAAIALAVNGRGAAAVAFITGTFDRRVLRVRRKPPGGAWRTASIVSGADERVVYPDVAIDSAGNVFVVWAELEPGSTMVARAAVLVPGVGWSPAVDVSSPGTFHCDSAECYDEVMPHIDVAAGRAVATWTREGRVEVVERTAGGAWSSPIVVSSATDIGPTRGTDVEVSRRGDVLVHWTRNQLWYAVRRSGESWESPRTVPESATYDADIALDGRGNALAVWHQAIAGPAYPLMTAYRPAGGSWSPRRVLDSDSGWDASIAFDEGGNGTVAWTDWVSSERSETLARATIRTARGTWEQPRRVSQLSPHAEVTDVAMRRNRALVAWFRVNEFDTKVGVATRPLQGTWRRKAISGNARLFAPLRIALDREANAFAAWPGQAATDPLLLAESPRHPPGCTIVGSTGPDVLAGTNRRDIICSVGGRDVVRGLGGDDLILLGSGNDVGYGGAGRDRIVGGLGRDVCSAEVAVSC